MEAIGESIDKIVETIKQALEISKEAHPSLTQMPDAFDGFEDTLQLLSTLDFGVFSIAHPGRTVVKDAETGKVITDLSEDGQRELILPGGRGGKGNSFPRKKRCRRNCSFKSLTRSFCFTPLGSASESPHFIFIFTPF